MLSLMGAILLGVVLPAPEDVPVLSAGESLELAPEGGEAWFRILEDDYVLLRVSVGGAAELTAFDAYGEPLCAGSGEMLLSAFSDYWFYVRVAVSAGSGRPVTAVVDEVPAGMLGESDRISSDVGRNEMAETFLFLPPRPGTWSFVLDGEDGTDLDLEVYGNRMSSWGSSMSLTGDERVSVPLVPGDSVTVVVSRFGKSGDGGFSLRAAVSGPFPVLRAGVSERAIGFDAVERLLVPGMPSPGLLSVAMDDPEVDIDVMVYDMDGGYVMGAQSYSPVEALLLPASDDTLVAEIVLYDAPDAEPVPYTLGLLRAEGNPAPPPVSRTLEVGGPDPAQPVCFSPDHAGFYGVRVAFDKLRDGDVLVFRESGEPVVNRATDRGDEELMLWADAGERLYLLPCFGTFGTSGDVEVTVEEASPIPVSGVASGEVGERSPAAFYVADAPAGSILYARLSGADGETDLDLYLTGPGVDLTAEAWFSNVDAPGNEAVTVYSGESTRYGFTVYMYERSGGTPFELDVRTLQSPPLAEGSGSAETWAMTVGISGYPEAADVLNRASMDAMEVHRFLTDDLGVPEDHVVVLVDAMATQDAFLGALRDLLDRAGPEDRVLVFFSGHGFQLAPGSGGPEESDSANEAICLFDGDLEDDVLAREIAGGSGAPVLVMLDACHSGGFVNDFPRGSNTLVLTAAREDLSVSERVLTPILLQGAKGSADEDGDGSVTALELMEYIDAGLQLVCPQCDARLEPGALVCPECGAVLKGENAVPRPEQGMSLDDPGIVLWPSTGFGGRGRGA